MPYSAGIDDRCIQEAGEYMRHYTQHFISPVVISTNPEDTEGEVLGSATFLTLLGKPYLLTNEHVALGRLHARLSFFQTGGERAAAITHPFQCLADPIDAAVARIDEDLFATSGKASLPVGSIDYRFQPADGEILFIHGYPGVRSRWSALAKGILANTFPYATDLMPLPFGFDEKLHFAMSFPDDIWTSRFQSEIRPNPRGLSGSAVWDTKYVAAGSGRWAPANSRLCGLVWGYNPIHQCLIATKIEAVREFLVSALRHEAAYFHWLTERNGEMWDAITDWSWAETMLPDLR